MAKPRLRKIIRVVHYWISLSVLLTGGLVAVTGTLLLLKKDVEWLQPPVVSASGTGIAEVGVDALFNAASNASTRPLHWHEINRIDIRPDDGIAKVITEDTLEYQVDLHTLEVLSIKHRGADIVEKIHDGTFFSSSVKYFVMIPSGVALFILWITGVYLFFLTQFQKWRNKRR